MKNDLDLKPLGCELRKYPSAIEWDVQLIPTKKEKLAVARDQIQTLTLFNQYHW